MSEASVYLLRNQVSYERGVKSGIYRGRGGFMGTLGDSRPFASVSTAKAARTNRIRYYPGEVWDVVEFKLVEVIRD